MRISDASYSRVLESGDEDLNAAVERAAGRVVAAVRVLVGGHGLGLAVASCVQCGAHAVLPEFGGHGVGAVFGELLVEGLVRDRVGVAVDVGGGNVGVVEDGGEFGEGLGGVGSDLGLAEVEEDTVLQGDERAAGLNRLQGLHRRERAELGDLLDLRSVLDGDAVDDGDAVTVVLDRELLVRVAARAVAVVDDEDVALGELSGAVAVVDDRLEGRAVGVAAATLAVQDDAGRRRGVGARPVRMDDKGHHRVGVRVVSRAVFTVDDRDGALGEGSGAVAIVDDCACGA